MPAPEKPFRACSTRVLSTMKTFARRQFERHLHGGILDDLAQAAIGGVVGLHLVVGHVGDRRRRTVVEADADQLAIRRQLDHRAARPQADAFAAGIFEPRAVFGEQVKALRIFGAQPRGRLEAVNHHVLAALGRVFQAIEDLQRRHRVAVGIVGMGLQPELRVGEVARVDLGADFEPVAVIGLADIAKEPGNFQERAAFNRPVGELPKAKAPDAVQPFLQLAAIGTDGIETGTWNVREARIPQFDFRGGPARLTRRVLIIAVRLQPGHVIGNGLALGREGQ